VSVPAVLCVHGGFVLNHEKSESVGFGARSASNEKLLIILTATVLLVGAWAIMNNACKSGPRRLMRSDLRRTASHKNWAQLRSGN
jgi:hypothetical protein